MARVTCMWPCLGSDLTARLLQLYPARSIFAYKDLLDIPAVCWPQSVILYPMTRSSSLGAHRGTLVFWNLGKVCGLIENIDTALHQQLEKILILSPTLNQTATAPPGFLWESLCPGPDQLCDSGPASWSSTVEREALVWSSKNRPGNTMAGRYNGINENPNNIYVCPNFSQIKAAPVSSSRLGIGPV